MLLKFHEIHNVLGLKSLVNILRLSKEFIIVIIRYMLDRDDSIHLKNQSII
jgi:hypothetical protein